MAKMKKRNCSKNTYTFNGEAKKNNRNDRMNNSVQCKNTK